MKLNLILASLFVLGVSIAMTGCEGGAKLEEELAATKATLEQTQQKLDAVSQARDLLQKQVTEMTKLRDEAVAAAKNAKIRIDELDKKFEEQAKVIRQLQEHIEQMQSAIEKL